MSTIVLQIPEPLEIELQARAAKQGRNVASVAVELIEQALESATDTGGGQVLTGDAWLREFDAWVKSHPPIDVVLDDSRETIYEGR